MIDKILKGMDSFFTKLLVFSSIVLGFVVCKPSFAQELDSLETVLKKQNVSLAEQIKICDDLSWGYLSTDFEKAKKYANKGIDIAQEVKDAKMIGILYRNLGVAYYMFSQMDTAKLYLDKALQYAEKGNDENLQAAIYGAIGNLFNREGSYKEALDYYYKSLAISEKTNNKQRVCKVYGNLGQMYRALNNFDKAEAFFLKTKDLSTELGDSFSLAQAFDGLSYIYMMRREAAKSLEYAENAAKILHDIGDKNNEAIAYQGIAMIYYNLTQDYNKAEEFANKALKLNEEIGFPSFITGSLNTLSNVYWQQRNYQKCSQIALKAIEIDTTDSNVMSNLVANIVRANIFLENKDIALQYFDRYRRIIDLKANNEFQNSLSEMEVKYKTEKKEYEIKQLKSEKRARTIIVFSLSVLLLFGAIAGFLLFKSLMQRRALAEQKVLRLEKEKQLVATQALLEGETTERARLSKDLHDGLGGLLSVTKHKIANMKGSLTIPEDQVGVFNSALEMLDSSIKELRRVAHNLMPESLMRYGLNSAISDFCNSIDKAEYHFYGVEKRLDEKLEIAAFRIVSELVNNALKHANASKISVQLVQELERVSITVYDDGCGFDPKSVDRSKSGGLNNIESRVVSFNGRLDVFSAPGKGTEISVEFKS